MTPPNPNCAQCKKVFTPGEPRWSCCPTHTDAMNQVCDNCAVKLHPDKAAIVTHVMYGADFTLPCCGVLWWEAPPIDRVSVSSEQIVTCAGKKRYRAKGDHSGFPNRAARRAAQRRRPGLR